MGDNHIIPTPEEDPFPGDAFTDTQRKNGAVILHVIGTLYMMYADAVLCYYFFVPSVLLITKRVIDNLIHITPKNRRSNLIPFFVIN